MRFVYGLCKEKEGGRVMAFTRMEVRHDLENTMVNDAWWNDDILDDYLCIDDGNAEDDYINLEEELIW